MIVVTTDQRSPAWYAARLGRLTGSRAADMLATIKSGEAAARRDYRLQLACERLTGRSEEDTFMNAAMTRGVELEPQAFAAYEALTGEMASTAGFLAHDELMAGCSPDGLVGAVGLLEVKCPKSSTMLGYHKSGQIPSTYLPQLTHNLWITGCAWADFFAYDDRLPDGLQVFCRRLYAKDLNLAAYELAAQLFLSEVEAEVEALTALAGSR